MKIVADNLSNLLANAIQQYIKRPSEIQPMNQGWFNKQKTKPKQKKQCYVRN